MFRRNILEHLQKLIETSLVVLLTGARQVGKTTLVQEIVENTEWHYHSFDDLFTLAAAEEDPIGFVENLKKPVILDEIQRAPKIFLPIKKDIDTNKKKGNYLFTGSANPLVIPTLGDSLAGRMQMVHLWPLSQGEIRNRKEFFIDAVFQNNPQKLQGEKLSRNQLIDMVIRGGYPALQFEITERERYTWCNSYLTTLIQKDISDLAKIENLRSIPQILQTLATRAAAILNERDLSRSIGIPLTTLRRYLQLLQHLFLIFFLPGWHRNLGKRIVKSSKIYFVDSAILLHLLGFNKERLLENLNILGHVVESFIVAEVQKQLTWSQTLASCYHYRTHADMEEVDLVLESTSGKVVGIEIKISETITAHDFKGLKCLQEEVGKDFQMGIVLYPGGQQHSFGKNMIALPISSLWCAS